MEKNNLISVIMPVYNTKKYLTASITSVLSQSYKNFELVIVDDSSNDQSYSIAEKFKKNDKRIKLFKNKSHLGVGATLNFAFKQTKGQYIARMDADDVMDPSRLEIQFKYLIKHPDIICLGSFMTEIDEKNKIIGKRTVPINHEKIYERMYFGMGIQNPTLMINKQLVPRNFSWCKTDGILDDLDLLFKLINFGKFGNLNEYLMSYRIHENNLSLKNIKKTFKEALNIRKIAVKKYSYKPTIKSKIIMIIQTIVITLFPEKLLYGLFKLFSKYEKLF